MKDAYQVQFENGLNEGVRRQKAKDADEIERLRGLLRRYQAFATHSDECDTVNGSYCCDCGFDGLQSETDAALAARLAEAERLLRRYYKETPLGHQPHMIAHEADAVLRTADSATPRENASG